MRWLLAVASVVGMSSVSYALDDYDREFIGETVKEVTLFTGGTLSDGRAALLPKVKLPINSLVNLDSEILSHAIELQANNPKDANFFYASSADDKNPRVSKDGWVCNIGILDVSDRDIEEDDLQAIYESKNLCINLKDVQSLQASAGNSEEFNKAFELYKKHKDASAILEIARFVKANPFNEDNADAEFQETDYSGGNEEAQLFDVGFAKRKLISPLQECDLKCLVIVSPYGPRNKKRSGGMSNFHYGVDLRTADSKGTITTGRPVVSVLRGRVMKRTAQVRRSGRYYGAGKYLIVRHRRAGMATKYFHLKEFVGEFRDGTSEAIVSKGQVIAYSGDTGGRKKTGRVDPHLHFETHVVDSHGRYSAKDPNNFMGRLKRKGKTVFNSIGSLFERFFAFNHKGNRSSQVL